MEEERKFRRNSQVEIDDVTMESTSTDEIPKKKKPRLGYKLAGRLQRARLNRSKGSMNVSFNTSRLRQTLKSNNKQLAQALAESRATINTLQKQNIELQSNNQKLVTQFNAFKHVCGLDEKGIEKEVEARAQIQVNLFSKIVDKMSTQFVALVETFYDLNSLSKKLKLRNSSEHPERPVENKPAWSLRTSNISEKSKVSDLSEQPNVRYERLNVPEELPGGDELSPEPSPHLSNPDLSVIMEQTPASEDSRGEKKYSRVSRRTAMTDFSTLMEYQDIDDEGDKNTELSPESQCAELHTEDIPPAVSSSTDLVSHGISDLGNNTDSQSSEMEIKSSDLSEHSLLPSETHTKTSRKSVRKSKRLRDSGQFSIEESISPAKNTLSTKSTEGENDFDTTEIYVQETLSTSESTTKNKDSSCEIITESNDDAPAASEDETQTKKRKSKNRRGSYTVSVPTKNGKASDDKPCSPEKQTKSPVKPSKNNKEDRRGTYEVPPKVKAQAQVPQEGEIWNEKSKSTDRRGTYAVPASTKRGEQPNNKPCSSEKRSSQVKPLQNKEDRRGTYEVPPKVKAQAKVPPVRNRRDTYDVEDDDILLQTGDVLITDDVLDQIESHDPSEKTSPTRSSLATTEGDFTINDVMDMDLTTTHGGTISSGETNASDPAKKVANKAVGKTKPETSKSKALPNAKPKPKDKLIKDKRNNDSKKTEIRKKTETGAPSAENDKNKTVFKAWLSKPGNITFTSGRKDLASLVKQSTQTSRSKQKSLVPKKPRSKSARSKPRLLPDMSPETVFDFSGTPRNAVQSSKSVYDMSLNESTTAIKKSYQEFKENPDAEPTQNKTRPTLKMVKERFASEPIEEATISPHGIMLVLGDGKRTKPRSKKAVSYSGKLTETHLTTPEVTSPPICIEDASRTPPGRPGRRSTSSLSSDDTITSDVTTEDAGEDVAAPPTSEEVTDSTDPCEISAIESEDHPQEISTLYEENVKIMPDAAPTPTPIKRLKGRKFTSTEEEMKALFESSLMRTPVVPQDNNVVSKFRNTQQHSEQSRPEAAVSEHRTIHAEDDKVKSKKSQQSDRSSKETTTDQSEADHQQEELKSLSHEKHSTDGLPVSPKPAVEQHEDVPELSEACNTEENSSPMQRKSMKKKPGRSVKKSRSRTFGEANTPRIESESETQTPKSRVSDNAPANAIKNRKRGSTQLNDDSEAKDSPKPKKSLKPDDPVFAVPGSPPKRRRRAAAVTSYKEPSLNVKMRKGEKDGTIFVNNVEVKKLVGSADKETSERKKSTDKRTALKEIVNS